VIALALGIRLSSDGFDENSVTPGVAGFVAIFLVAAATILLLLDMTRRVRRARYRGEIAERLDAEEAAAAASGGAAGSGSPDADQGPDGLRDPRR
jgi:hypothetical protein